MPIVVLDRDGVINIDSADYIKSAEEWQPLPGSIKAIALLCDKGYDVYVATNQAGIARGLFSLSDLEAMHRKLRSLVKEEGGEIAGIRFCPHHPDDQCSCRKPKPGLLKQIATDSGESIQGQAFVGDSLKDLQAARAVNAKAVLVLTGNGQKTRSEIPKELESAVSVFENLAAFADSVQAIQSN